MSIIGKMGSLSLVSLIISTKPTESWTIFLDPFLYKVCDCTSEINFFTSEEEKMTQEYTVVKEFVDSICNELGYLLHLGSSLTAVSTNVLEFHLWGKL